MASKPSNVVLDAPPIFSSRTSMYITTINRSLSPFVVRGTWMPFLIPNALTCAKCIVDVGVLAFAIIVSSACSSQQTVRTLADLFVISMVHRLLILRMSVVNSTNMMKAISIRFPCILFRHANVNKVHTSSPNNLEIQFRIPLYH
jgi:hypothetical protein